MKKIVDLPGDDQAPFDPLEYEININYSDEYLKAITLISDEIEGLHLSNKQAYSLIASIRRVQKIVEHDAFLNGFEVATKFFTGEELK